MKNSTIIGIVAIAFILVFGFILYDKLPSQNTKTISSSGTSTIKSMPDEASLYIRIDTIKQSADESKKQNSEISNKILYELYKLGIEKKDIETSQYNIYEEFDWSQEGRKSLGYKTQNILKLKLKDFDLIGKAVDAATSAGATGIDSINFELSDEKQREIKKEALTKASQDARAKAEATVSGLNIKLGDIVSITGSNYDYRPYPLYAKDSGIALAEATTNIMPKELEVTANVEVVFEL